MPDRNTLDEGGHVTLSRAGLLVREALTQRQYRRFRSVSGYWRLHPLYGYIGWLGHRNLGDEIFLDAFGELFPEASFILWGTIPADMAIARRLLHRRRGFDAVFLGGGTLIGAGYLRHLASAQSAGSATAVFGTGVRDGEFWGSDESTADWAGVLRTAAYVSVRGPLSAARLQSWGVEGVEVVGDPALAACTPRPEAWAARGLVAVNLGCSGPIWGEQERILAELLPVLRALVRTGHRIEYLPMHPSDLQYARHLHSELGQAFSVWRYSDDRPRTLRRIRDYDLVIGQRLHSTVLAMGSGVPAISLEYRPKCTDFLASVGLPHLGCRTDQLTAGRLDELVHDCLSSHVALSRDINRACDRLRASLRSAATTVSSRLERHSRTRATVLA